MSLVNRLYYAEVVCMIQTSDDRLILAKRMDCSYSNRVQKIEAERKSTLFKRML